MTVNDDNNYTPKRVEEIFSLYRDYLKHEDNLINQRTTWLITIQSFLIATFGFSYQKKFEILTKFYSDALTRCNIPIQPREVPKDIFKGFPEIGEIIRNYNHFFYALNFIGLITSILALISISAAVAATFELRNKWYGISSFSQPLILNREHSKRISNYSPLFRLDHLPDISGGGSKYAHFSGKALSIIVPLSFLVFWLTVFIMLFANYL